MKTDTLAKLCVAYSGVAWGLFWMPLHALTANGLTPHWAAFMFNFIPALLVLPFMLWRWRRMRSGGILLLATGVAMGLTQVFYAMALLHTEVVRAITIFYLNPVWTALAAHFLLHERLGWSGVLSMGLAFLGMGLVLHSGFSFPLPRNAGDWYAIVAGFAWAASVILLRLQPHIEPFDLGIQSMSWTGLFLLLMPLMVSMGEPPTAQLVIAQLWWLLPFLVLVLMTGIFSSMWAVPKLPANLVTLIYMTEISTAAITAALFADQSFTMQDALGVSLITLAGALSSIIFTVQQWARRRAAP